MVQLLQDLADEFADFAQGMVRGNPLLRMNVRKHPALILRSSAHLQSSRRIRGGLNHHSFALARFFSKLLDRSSASGRALVERRITQIPDVLADADYTFDEALKFGGFRTALGVPMLREGVPVGALALTRKDVRPFTDKQVELVSTFADQAAIAIENARLFEAE